MLRDRRSPAIRVVRAAPPDSAARNAELIAAPAKLVAQKPSRSFGKCCQLLEETRPHRNPKRIYRVYYAMKLSPRRAAKRRLPMRERVPLWVPENPDTVLSADVMLVCAGVRPPLQNFKVTDELNREAVHVEIDASITTLRLVCIFERIRHEPPLP